MLLKMPHRRLLGLFLPVGHHHVDFHAVRIAMLITAGINVRLQRDFAAEWNESLRVKSRRPLGEDEMRRLLNRGDA